MLPFDPRIHSMDEPEIMVQPRTFTSEARRWPKYTALLGLCILVMATAFVWPVK